MYELAGNLHMHTPCSDGEKYHAAIAEDAIKAGLDFVIVTDHTTIDYQAVVRAAPLVIDTRNATRNVREGREKVFKA